jgi:hypothetical protein
MKDYQERLSELFNRADIGQTGTLLLYTHHNWGMSYVLGFNSGSKCTDLVIWAKTLCQMDIEPLDDVTTCGVTGRHGGHAPECKYLGMDLWNCGTVDNPT